MMLAKGLDALDKALEGGPTAKIAEALMKLIAATRRPSWMDDATAAVYFGTLQEAMHDYPVDCVEDACTAWRRGDSGEWWPAEKELRRVCDRLFEPRRKLKAQAERLLADLSREEAAQERARQPSHFAGSRHAHFREALRKRLGQARFEAWFDSGDVLFEGENTLLFRIKGAPDTIMFNAADLVGEYGVKLEWRPDAFKDSQFRRWQEPTEADRADVSEKFARLKKAMAAGADLAPMRARGEI